MPRYALHVNGRDHEVAVSSPDMPLLWVLRDVIGLTGTKYGCGIEACGACTVLVNGQAKKSCCMPVSAVIHERITTIEGLSSDRSHPAQRAWIAHQVPQCGFCQCGMLMRVAGAMNAGLPSEGIAEALQQHICTCGSYPRIQQAVAAL